MTNAVTEIRPFQDVVEKVLGALNQQTSGIADPEAWLIEALGGNNDSAGVRVTEWTSLGWPPLYAAVSRIAGHIATMPFRIVRKVSTGGYEEVDDERNKLALIPNSWQTGATMRELVQMNALLHGNGRAFISRDTLGNPVELVPLLAYNTRTILIEGIKYHWTITPSYWDYTLGVLEQSRQYYVPDSEVIHIPGMGGNGAWGNSIIQMFRDTIGTGIAGTLSAAKSFQNMGRPGIILEAPAGKFRDKKKADEFMKKFDANQAGIDNVGKTAMLREGVTAKLLTMNQSDAEFLKQRVHQREEASLIMYLEIMQGDRGPYKSITEKNTQYLINCLSRWKVKWEQEWTLKTLSEEERAAGLCWMFDPTFLLQGDPNTLADYTGKLRQQGAISGNDVRIMHNMNRVEDEALETYTNPNTTAPSAIEAPGDEAEEREEEEDREERGRLAARNAIRARLEVLGKVERKKVIAFAQKENFRTWMHDDFYPKFENQLIEAVEELGGTRDLATDYVRDSMDVLSELALTIDPMQLDAVVQDTVNEWGHRFTEMTDEILNGVLSNAI